MSGIVIDLDVHPSLVHGSGRGVSVAVVDSGVHAAHPHVQGVAGGVSLLVEGGEDDFVDRIGHGTAVAAAIKEKAPDAAIYAVKVFEQTLTTNARILARAIDWAVGHNVRLINLSLGTTNQQHADLLERSVRRVSSEGSIVVAAYAAGDTRWLPGSLPGVAGVLLDWERPRQTVRVERDERGRLLFHASGYPRPIPGVPPARNLRGISFAVANVSGILARLMEVQPHARTLEEIGQLLLG